MVNGNPKSDGIFKTSVLKRIKFRGFFVLPKKSKIMHFLKWSNTFLKKQNSISTFLQLKTRCQTYFSYFTKFRERQARRLEQGYRCAVQIKVTRIPKLLISIKIVQNTKLGKFHLLKDTKTKKVISTNVCRKK